MRAGQANTFEGGDESQGHVVREVVFEPFTVDVVAYDVEHPHLPDDFETC